MLVLIRWLRKRVQWLMHPIRHRKAARRLCAQLPISSVLVVCHGNICRSPYAAAALLRDLPVSWSGRVHVTSAGFLESGRPAPGDAVSVGREKGVDLARHCSRRLDGALVEGAELVLVMDSRQRRAIRRRFGRKGSSIMVMGDLGQKPHDRRTIMDPIDKGPGVFRQSYGRIDECIGELVRIMTDSRAVPGI